MRIEEDVKLDYSDVLFRPKRSTLSSRNDVNIERTFNFTLRNGTSYEYTCVPIMAANMDMTGTIEMAKAFFKYKMNVALHKFYDNELLVEFLSSEKAAYSWYTMGITDNDYRKFSLFRSMWKERHKTEWQGRLCLDAANGYTERFLNFVRKIVNEVEIGTLIMAGNIATAEMAEALILEGVHIAKSGIGPGSACRTREMSGVGIPQLSCVIETADAAHGIGGYICADGGCNNPGDIAKAFGGGADFVMIGGMFSAHAESGGELIKIDDKMYKKFYGMSSEEAMNKYYGGMASHRASEGRSTLLPYRGPIDNTVQDILGGIRSMMTYIGAKRLKDIPKCTTFVKVNRQLNTSLEQYTTGK